MKIFIHLPTLDTKNINIVSAFLCGGKVVLDKKVSLTDSKSFH